MASLSARLDRLAAARRPYPIDRRPAVVHPFDLERFHAICEEVDAALARPSEMAIAALRDMLAEVGGR
jgi:hypothetical protein